MACLEMRKGSKWWYGRWTANKRTVVKNLGIKIAGSRPASVNLGGDRRFEASRAQAQAALDSLVKQSQDRRHSEDLVQALHEIRTGQKIGKLPLNELVAAWEQTPRRRKPSSQYMAWGRQVLAAFVQFLKAHRSEAAELADVTHADAVTFFAYEEKRGVSARTYNSKLTLLRGVCRHLRRQTGLAVNPFEDVIAKEEDTIHRKPFAPEELKAILEAVQHDEFCRPLIVAGICTAMRLGDVCLLKWQDIDLKAGFISVKTLKTKERVAIPLFPLLQDDLAKLPHVSEYCFPEQAKTYERNSDQINRRMKAVFRAAGFVDLEEANGEGDSDDRPSPDTDEIRRKWAEVNLDGSRLSLKVRANLPKVFDLYMSGKTTGEIAETLQVSKGTVSHYLHRIESLIGVSIIRPRSAPVKAVETVRGSMYEEREGGLQRVSVRGFHAFRATWVTLALSSGVPIELVRRVTGHTTVETVLTHYFQPGREDFRKALLNAMPQLLTSGGAPGRDEQMREILRHTSAKMWARDSRRLLELLEAGRP